MKRARIEIARCRLCGNEISRVSGPDEAWRHNVTPYDRHEAVPLLHTIRELMEGRRA